MQGEHNSVQGEFNTVEVDTYVTILYNGLQICQKEIQCCAMDLQPCARGLCSPERILRHAEYLSKTFKDRQGLDLIEYSPNTKYLLVSSNRQYGQPLLAPYTASPLWLLTARVHSSRI